MTEIPVSSTPTLWRRATAAYAKLLEVLLAACVGILVIPVTLQIVSRYTPLIPSYIWTEEMARFLFVWTIMIGAMLGVREAQHFEVDVWPDLSRRSEAAVRILARFGVLALALVFLWAGIEFTRFAWNRTSEKSKRFAFQCWRESVRMRRRSARPTISLMVRKPSSAINLRASSAT